MPIIKFSVGSRLKMKKKHPCSSDVFKIIRVGSDVRVICDGCGRDMTFSRETLEKIVKKILPDNSVE